MATVDATMRAITYYGPSPTLDERIHEIDNLVQNAVGGVTPEARDKITTFFLVAHSIIEDHSAKLIYTEVFSEEAATDDAIDYLNSSVSQMHREKMLYSTGIIDGRFHADLQRVRGTRNRIAHTYGQPIVWNGDPKEEAIFGKETFDELYKICTE